MGFKQHIKKLSAMSLLTILIVSFQNCSGEFKPTDEIVFNSQAIFKSSNDKVLFNQLMNSSNLISYYNSSNYKLADFPLSSSTTEPRVMTLSTGQGGLVFSAAGKESLQSNVRDNLFSDQFTIVAVLTGPLQGKILTLMGGGSKINEMSISSDGKTMLIEKSIDASNLVNYSMPSPSSTVILAVSFGVKSDDVTLVLNGYRVTVPMNKVGNPVDSAYILRQLILGDPSSGADFILGEMYVYDKALDPWSLGVLSRGLAPKWGMNFAVDSSLNLDPNLTGKPKVSFSVAKGILQKNCFSCHGSKDPGFSSGWSSWTEDDFISYRVIYRGNPSASPLYNRLSGVGGDMPKAAPALSGSDLATLRNWINGL